MQIPALSEMRGNSRTNRVSLYLQEMLPEGDGDGFSAVRGAEFGEKGSMDIISLY